MSREKLKGESRERGVYRKQKMSEQGRSERCAFCIKGMGRMVDLDRYSHGVS